MQLFSSLSYAQEDFVRHAVDYWDLVVLLDFLILTVSLFILPNSFL